MKIYFGENGNLFYHANVWFEEDLWCLSMEDYGGVIVAEYTRKQLYDTAVKFLYDFIYDYAEMGRAFLPITPPVPSEYGEELWGFEIDSETTALILSIFDNDPSIHWRFSKKAKSKTNRLPALKFRQVSSFLRSNRFRIVRQDGSHVIFKNSKGKEVVVPNHGSKDLRHGLVNDIVKKSGIPMDEWKSHRFCRNYFGTKNISYGRDVI